MGKKYNLFRFNQNSERFVYEIFWIRNLECKKNGKRGISSARDYRGEEFHNRQFLLHLILTLYSSTSWHIFSFHSSRNILFKSNSTFHVDTQLYILSGGLLSIRFNSRYLWVLIRILCLLCPVGLFVSHPSPVRSNCLEMPTIINWNSRSGNNNEYWRETCCMCFTTIRVIRLQVENKTYYMI